MARFLNHSNIKKELLDLFKTADEMIFLVSPFIKLNEEMRRALSRKKDDVDFEIVVLFGKNEYDLSKSLSREDMEFFKQFQNVEILYNPDLHAKYYSNESKSIVTSLNLHQYSVRNNIEIGILFERTFMNFNGDKQLDSEIFEYLEEILDESEVIYDHNTKQESHLFGLFKGKKKKHVRYDATSQIYNEKNGYCIRTGQSIPFNMYAPFSKSAYDSWSIWQNENYGENFCHFSGEQSFGETSFARPVLSKNYRKAVELQNS